jgi:hypothetical protein
MFSWKSKSQAYQDYFAYQVAKNKSYIEIGAYKPNTKNNTYFLEVLNGWKGFSVELNEKFKLSWENCTERKNPIKWDNAITHDYNQTLLDLKMPKRIGYLSCDIEPVNNTFNALQRVIEQGIEFDCITFEHDFYQSKEDYREIVDNYLSKHNYRVAVHDVYCREPKFLFETWYVKNDIKFKTVSFDQWKQQNNL